MSVRSIAREKPPMPEESVPREWPTDGHLLFFTQEGYVLHADRYLACACTGEWLYIAARMLSLFAFVGSAAVTGIVFLRAAPWHLLTISFTWLCCAIGVLRFAMLRKREHGYFIIDLSQLELIQFHDTTMVQRVSFRDLRGMSYSKEESTWGSTDHPERWLLVRSNDGRLFRLAKAPLYALRPVENLLSRSGLPFLDAREA